MVADFDLNTCHHISTRDTTGLVSITDTNPSLSPESFCRKDMSTPYMLFMSFLKQIIWAGTVLWLCTFTVSRIFIFCEALNLEKLKVMDEKYLVEKCKDPEFFSNIRQHTDLCTEVTANANSNLYLKALNTVATQTHLCGARPCHDTLNIILHRMGWQSGMLLAAGLILFPNVALIVARRFFHGAQKAMETHVWNCTQKNGFGSNSDEFSISMLGRGTSQRGWASAPVLTSNPVLYHYTAEPPLLEEEDATHFTELGAHIPLEALEFGGKARCREIIEIEHNDKLSTSDYQREGVPVPGMKKKDTYVRKRMAFGVTQ